MRRKKNLTRAASKLFRGLAYVTGLTKNLDVLSKIPPRRAAGFGIRESWGRVEFVGPMLSGYDRDSPRPDSLLGHSFLFLQVMSLVALVDSLMS